MNQSLIRKQWLTLRDSATEGTKRLQNGASGTARQLMESELERFHSQGQPSSKHALEEAYTRRMALSARLTAISRADAMAAAHQNIAHDIFEQVRTFCSNELPATSDDFLAMTMSNIELTQSLAATCAKDLALNCEVG